MQKRLSNADRKRLTFTCGRCEKQDAAFLNTERSRLLLCRDCYGRGKDRRPRELNNLSGSDWARASRSIEFYPDTRSEKQRLHGASFAESLALEQIAIYTKVGDLVFDPFVGVGTTMDAALALGRKAVGIDINQRFTSIARKDLRRRGFVNGRDFEIFTLDACKLHTKVEPSSVDFTLTSPPYSTLLRNIRGDFAFKWREHSTIKPISNPAPYTTKSADFGNMPYERFLSRLTSVMESTYLVSKPDVYCAWIVKDFRDLRNGLPLVPFHVDVIECATSVGFILWDIRIVDQTKFRPLVCLGFPSRNFYLNIGHSYILIFRKPAD